ncbi:prefoldin subunit 6 [Harpegnathos saltator]|uniref:Probable prefoldin subunit 6 n=1 Tax=Harpegnathos saltator TaxID=610380 RepID=E2BJE0_HARSA|nr:prefoldin subunit 6 [Harpegnathos saltator]XP_011139944.1 prefoldin subunit 6 [Harpegnathos saltator]XP_025159583.1 prefoldin subunit 6 [Harpegnathos saltator]XP_025159584.1 prefoldin subunit 6 [Harpegnathos saltator]EFN84290.1 Prefoldin subunit 6 [Harpegnathos saltator]
MVEEIQKKLQSEVDKLRQVQKDYSKAVNKRQQLDGQLNENIAVKKELDLLKQDNDVFKLIGPVLVKQDLEEAKQNVTKRMDYITAELKRMEDLIATLDKKMDTHREALEKIQQTFQQAQIKALSQQKA